MSRIAHQRECSWSNSGESSEASDGEDQHTRLYMDTPAPQIEDITRRGPTPDYTPEELAEDRMIWKHCLVGHLMDTKKYSTHFIQQWINRVWELGDNAEVLSRDKNKVVIYFEKELDKQFVLQENPWSIDGSMILMEEWRENTKLKNMTIQSTPIWMQIWGLPLEYLSPHSARKFGSIAGRFEGVDWPRRITRNIRFLRARVWVNPNKPLIAGSFYRRDDGVRDWVDFKYERLHRLCVHCGRIGHTRTHCTFSDLEVERDVTEQMEAIRREHGYDIGYDGRHKLFSSAMRAHHRRGRRKTTRITYLERGESSHRGQAAQEGHERRDEETRIQPQNNLQGTEMQVVGSHEEANAVERGGEQQNTEETVTPENSPRAPPTTPVGLQQTEFLAMCEDQRRRLDNLFANMSEQGDKLLEELMNRLYHDPDTQAADNKPRWIQGRTGMSLYTNGRLFEKNRGGRAKKEEPESSTMGTRRGKRRAGKEKMGEEKPFKWALELSQKIEGDDITELVVKKDDPNQSSSSEESQKEQNAEQQDGNNGGESEDNINTSLFAGLENITDEDLALTFLLDDPQFIGGGESPAESNNTTSSKKRKREMGEEVDSADAVSRDSVRRRLAQLFVEEDQSNDDANN
ncbi:hypothetical protein COLO4_21887 [Corchorus olitorius]|uniref:CCHC-type domain-containing protein n=1 Tax=Corchorus olitorius TaxID=93759 RepID=A0A1R3IQ62_9ROSI|nr:hypothetical protein COLO4_21887 [Corchorus olitorius]